MVILDKDVELISGSWTGAPESPPTMVSPDKFILSWFKWKKEVDPGCYSGDDEGWFTGYPYQLTSAFVER